MPSSSSDVSSLLCAEIVIDELAAHYQDDPRSPLMSPVIWPTGHHSLPPTYFQIAGSDPFRDEALIYEKQLREDFGVATRTSLYPGLPHGFWSWWPTAEFSKRHARDLHDGLEWLLGSRTPQA
jgi:acetyl esterase/lipase